MSFSKPPKASAPCAEKLSIPWRDLRADEEHTTKILCSVHLLVGSKLVSQQAVLLILLNYALWFQCSDNIECFYDLAS